jgi:hypothetical protein
MKKIKDFEKYTIYEDGRILSARGAGKFLRPILGRGGYYKVCLKDKTKGRRRWVYIHRLICETFIPNPMMKREINHIDGNKLNNFVTNLEWVTRSENGFHAFKNGFNVPAVGERSSNHKLTELDVNKIRSLRGVIKQKEIREMYDISIQHISNIQLGKFWKHLLPKEEVNCV